MNFNYLKIAWRVLIKNRISSIINIIGLGLGLSATILIMIYVHHQLRFDSFHEHADRIYRFTIEGSMADGKHLSAAFTNGEVADHILMEVPEAQQVCRVFNWGVREVMVNEKRFLHNQVLWVDSSFFDIFSFPLSKGNIHLALSEPASLILTYSNAEKLFGKDDPMDQTVRLAGMDYRVTGLMPDPPAYSHLQFDMLASFHSLERGDFSIVQQSGLSFPTYVLKSEHAHTQNFIDKACAVADKHTLARFGGFGFVVKHSLQPLNRIYLHSDYNFDMAQRGDIKNVYVFSLLALAVIIIAVFNFINLVTAQSEKRLREIGMRKVLGAFRKDLVFQFIGEAVLIALTAFVLALVLNELFIKEFSLLLGENLRLEYWYHPPLLIAILALVLLTGVVAGLYPAAYLSGFQPAKVLKGDVKKNTGAGNSRKALVILQFAISVFLITSVLLLSSQVRYMQRKDLGFDQQNIVAVTMLTESLRNSYPGLRAELMQHPHILSVTASYDVPGETLSVQNCHRTSDDPSASIMVYEKRVQHHFLETYRIPIVQGRDFDPQMQTDTAALIINQAAARKLGMENPIGQDVVVWEHTGRIIGVMQDYHFMSLHHTIDPLVLTMHDPVIARISVRMDGSRRSETLAWMKDFFEKADPNYSFSYMFVGDHFAQMYQDEERANRLIRYAALLAIVISFMGLYALASFSIRQRVKEIGIRKTLGAPVRKIILLLFRELTFWVIMGNLIAWPLAYYVSYRWLQNFAYQIHLPRYWYLFLIAGAAATLVGVAATLMQAWKAAVANPVDSIKAEG